MIVAICDDLLNDLKSRVGIAGEIRALLLRDIANPPTLAAVTKCHETRPPRGFLLHADPGFRSMPIDNIVSLATKAKKPVCTENLIRVDDVLESPKLAE